ncbi:hypothetical protein ACEQPO_27110 [Bacillus sp. SL00103]
MFYGVLSIAETYILAIGRQRVQCAFIRQGDILTFCDVYMEEGESLTFQYVTEDQMDYFEFQLSIHDGQLCFIGLHGMDLIIFTCLQVIRFIQMFFINL